MESTATSIPEGMYKYIYKRVFQRILDTLQCNLNVDPDECLDDCIVFSCRWLHEHSLECKEFDCNVSAEEIVDSFRKGCPEAEITKTAPTSYGIKLTETYWSLYRVVNPGWSETNKMRLAYKFYSHNGFITTNQSPRIIKYIDSHVSELRAMAQRMIMEGNREMMITLIQKTAKEARRKK